MRGRDGRGGERESKREIWEMRGRDGRVREGGRGDA